MQHYNLKRNYIETPQAGLLLKQGLDRLPHALLLTGPEGLGKAGFGAWLAHLLLCESPKSNRSACGECQACHWIAGGNHPDFRHVAPAAEGDEESESRDKPKKRFGGNIKIDQVRELESFIAIGSHRMGRRVVLMTETETMNGAAANSLLKILEEPPASVYFILVSSKQRFLLPTIRSRCRVLAFAPPETEGARRILNDVGCGKEAERYLGLAGGAPLRVARWKENGMLEPLGSIIDSLISPPGDPMALANRWDGILKAESGFKLTDLVEAVQRWIFDAIQDALAGQIHYHGAWNKPAKPAGGYSAEALIGAWQELIQFRRSASHTLNQQLFLENIAAEFLRALRPVRQ
ncbi:MAG: DNA polymerase III subunit delta' [Rhodocyclales bacterium]|nr:DNA polymerase III subunit delta' [Rhodocyclales bacterium]